MYTLVWMKQAECVLWCVFDSIPHVVVSLHWKFHDFSNNIKLNIRYCYSSIVMLVQTEPLIQSWAAPVHSTSSAICHPVNTSGKTDRYMPTWIIHWTTYGHDHLCQFPHFLRWMKNTKFENDRIHPKFTVSKASGLSLSIVTVLCVNAAIMKVKDEFQSQIDQCTLDTHRLPRTNYVDVHSCASNYSDNILMEILYESNLLTPTLINQY